MSAITAVPLVLDALPGAGDIVGRIVDILGNVIPVVVQLAVLLAVGVGLAFALDKVTYQIARAADFDSRVRETPLAGTLGDAEDAASVALGAFVKYLVVVFTILTAIGFLNIGVIQNVNQQLLTLAPRVLAAVAVLVVGLVVGRAANAVVSTGLEGRTVTEITRQKADDLTADVEITDSRLATLGAVLVEYYIYLVAVLVAADILEIPTLTRVVETAVFYAPRLIGAVAIVALALIVGTMAAAIVKNSESAKQLPSPAILGEVTKAVIVLFGSLIALEVAGASTTLLLTVLVVIGLPIGIGLALAIGLAFGYGARDYIGENIDDWA